MVRNLLSRIADVRREQSGVSVVLVALMMSVLLGMAAFAVDFGWIYWNVIKIQHGADAAALSGVIYEPGSQVLAYGNALEAAAENGYVHGSPGTTVVPVDFEEDSTAVENANQLRVTVSDNVPTFFMSIFGFDSITISKHAIAEYVLPLAMGSDLPYFGTDPSNPAHSPNFWGNIHGYYTGRTMGDRYSSQCNHGGAGEGCDANPDARPTVSQGTSGGFDDYSGGYIYGIEVEEDFGDLTVEVFDGPFYRDGHDRFLVGDNPQGSNETERDQGPTTRFMLYAPDPTPLNTADNTLLCSVSFGPEDNFADFDGDDNIGSWDSGAELWTADPDDDQNGDGWFDWTDIEAAFSNPAITHLNSWADLWDTLCTVDEGPGIYPLRVVIDDPGMSDDRGLNRYSLRTSTSGSSEAQVYGLGDMAIYANFAGNQATFDLAEVVPLHAGKELVIELWDPDSGNNRVTIRQPDGSLPQCTWSATDGRSGGPMGCDIGFGTSFNDHHMQIRIQIDTAYDCDITSGPGCWWTIEVGYPGGANDTTTWSARIEGNPVRLVE
ncbi:MAG: pilus assembly protein TadG-related protein [Acidimicrobiia bacterium]